MTYGEFLKKLIIFTNTKIMVIANETGYDISYISKWCNKGILPTTRTISVINKKLSKVFANEIVMQDRVEDFFISFSDMIEKKETDTENLFDFLSDSIETALSVCLSPLLYTGQQVCTSAETIHGKQPLFPHTGSGKYDP